MSLTTFAILSAFYLFWACVLWYSGKQVERQRAARLVRESPSSAERVIWDHLAQACLENDCEIHDSEQFCDRDLAVAVRALWQEWSGEDPGREALARKIEDGD